MVSSLILENDGAPLNGLPLMLNVRDYGALTYSLATYVVCQFRQSPLKNAFAIILVLTSLSSQISSTLLINDLQGDMALGPSRQEVVYFGDTNPEGNDTYFFPNTLQSTDRWSSVASQYPVFAEFSEPPKVEKAGRATLA